MAWNTLTFPLTLAQDGATATPPADAPPKLDRPSNTSTESTTVDKDGQPLGDPDGNQGGGGLFGGGNGMMLMMLLLVVVMFIFLSGGQRKEKKRRAAMLAAMTKGDKVQTVGGIIGTVVEVRDSEIVVKVDENSNTRMHFSRAAIQSVLEDGKPVDDPKK